MAVALFLHASVKPCVRSKLLHFHLIQDWTASAGMATETEAGKEQKCRPCRRTGAVMKCRIVSLTHSKTLNSHVQGRRWGKKDDLFPASKDCFTTRNGKSRRKRHLLQHRSSFWTNQEAFSGHCYNRLQLGLSSSLFMFFYTFFFNALGFQLPLQCSAGQRTRGCSFS